MSFADDWLGNGLPTFNGDKNKNLARTMIHRMGGPGGFKTDTRTSADGVVTSVQLKGNMPPQVTVLKSPRAAKTGDEYLFWYSYALNVDYAATANHYQAATKNASLTPYLAHDGVIDVWQRKSTEGAFEHATKIKYSSQKCALWEPSGGDDYIFFPAVTVDGVAYVGNQLHGLIGRALSGELWLTHSILDGPIAGAVSALEVVSPDTCLTLLNPAHVDLVTPTGVLTKYSILGTYDRIYDYVTGVKVGKNRSIYDAPDGERFAISIFVDSSVARYDESATSIATVYATRTTPKVLAAPDPTPQHIGTFTCSSPAIHSGSGHDDEATRCTIYTCPSPSGKKVCLSVVRASRLSDDFRWTEYLSAIYELSLSGGSATTFPSASIAYLDSTANDVYVTEYSDTSVRFPSYPKFLSQVDVINSETFTGTDNSIRVRQLTRTSTYSTNSNPKKTIHGVSMTKRSQLATAGYNASGGDTLQIVRVEVEAEYDRKGYDDDDTVVSIREFSEEAYDTGTSGLSYYTYKTTPGAVTSISGTLPFMLGELLEVNPWSYPHDTTATVTARVLVNGSTRYSETSNARSDAGHIDYVADPQFGPVDIEAYMRTAYSITEPSSSGDTANALPVIYAENWKNQAIGYSSNNTVVWDFITGANSRMILITIDGSTNGAAGGTDSDGRYWVSYNPFTKETSNIRNWIWI